MKPPTKSFIRKDCSSLTILPFFYKYCVYFQVMWCGSVWSEVGYNVGTLLTTIAFIWRLASEQSSLLFGTTRGLKYTCFFFLCYKCIDNALLCAIGFSIKTKIVLFRRSVSFGCGLYRFLTLRACIESNY